jgi:repressor LexA
MPRDRFPLPRPRKPKPDHLSNRTGAAVRATLQTIPVCGAIPAGMPDSRQQEGSCIRIDLESVGLPKNMRTFALRVSGDSMIGAAILDKDIVICEFKAPHENAVVAALVDGETTLKRYVVRNGSPYLKAENPKYKDVIPARELVIQGVMVALVRKA